MNNNDLAKILRTLEDLNLINDEKEMRQILKDDSYKVVYNLTNLYKEVVPLQKILMSVVSFRNTESTEFSEDSVGNVTNNILAALVEISEYRTTFYDWCLYYNATREQALEELVDILFFIIQATILVFIKNEDDLIKYLNKIRLNSYHQYVDTRKHNPKHTVHANLLESTVYGGLSAVNSLGYFKWWKTCTYDINKDTEALKKIVEPFFVLLYAVTETYPVTFNEIYRAYIKKWQINLKRQIIDNY